MDHVDIIIPCRFLDWMALESLQGCDALDYADFALCLVPDKPLTASEQEQLTKLHLRHAVTVLPSGKRNPAFKRNVALRATQGQIVALIDADAYPRRDWLKQAVSLLAGDVGIVAGPNLTPPDDPIICRTAGVVMTSPLGFGAAYIRHTVVSRRNVNEMPTCNMIFRREAGLLFRENFDTAEDMLFCADARARGKTIVYDPEVVVFHHRRPLWRPFGVQFFNYGYDKARMMQETNAAVYLWQVAPALFTVYCVVLPMFLLASLSFTAKVVFTIPLMLYLMLVTFESVRLAKVWAEQWRALPAFMFAHLSYGAGYLLGLLKRGR